MSFLCYSPNFLYDVFYTLYLCIMMCGTSMYRTAILALRCILYRSAIHLSIGFCKKLNYLFLHSLAVYFSAAQIAEHEDANQQEKYGNCFYGHK